MAAIRVKRGTRAQLEAAKTAGTLAAGEPYLITDEGALAVGTAADAYAVAAAGAHDHASNKLSQANTHESADTDTATTALHHTIGTSANQAAAGNHTHTASAVGFTPAGALAATNVQAAIEELDTEKAPALYQHPDLIAATAATLGGFL